VERLFIQHCHSESVKLSVSKLGNIDARKFGVNVKEPFFLF
jgi:hypothetical protein